MTITPYHIAVAEKLLHKYFIYASEGSPVIGPFDMRVEGRQMDSLTDLADFIATVPDPDVLELVEAEREVLKIAKECVVAWNRDGDEEQSIDLDATIFEAENALIEAVAALAKFGGKP